MDQFHPHIVQKTKCWNPIKIYRITCINDGVTREFLGPSTRGGIFKNQYTNLRNCFNLNISNFNLFIYELIRIKADVKTTLKNGRNSMWLDIGSQLMTLVVNLITLFLDNKEKDGLIALRLQQQFIFTSF